MATENGFSIALDATDPVVVLRASGELDAATTPTLDAALDRAIADHEHHVVIDACAITFVDSTGISTLVGGLRRLNRSRRRLALACATSGPLGRALEITGLDHTFECHATPESAVGALAAAPLIGR